MTKEDMAMQIPKGFYCNGTDFHCPWYKHVGTIKLHKPPVPEGYFLCNWSDNCKESCFTDKHNSCRHEVVKCEYLGITDWEENTHLWDACKQCDVEDGVEEEDKEDQE